MYIFLAHIFRTVRSTQLARISHFQASFTNIANQCKSIIPTKPGATVVGFCLCFITIWLPFRICVPQRHRRQTHGCPRSSSKPLGVDLVTILSCKQYFFIFALFATAILLYTAITVSVSLFQQSQFETIDKVNKDHHVQNFQKNCTRNVMIVTATTIFQIHFCTD